MLFDKVDLNFVSWQVKSNKFICIFVLTGKIQQIYLNFCSDVQCLKSQTFSNSCAKNRLDFLAKVDRCALLLWRHFKSTLAKLSGRNCVEIRRACDISWSAAQMNTRISLGRLGWYIGSNEWSAGPEIEKYHEFNNQISPFQQKD